MCYDKNIHVYDTGRHMWGSKLRGYIFCKVCGVITMIDEVGHIKPYECELDRPEGWWGPADLQVHAGQESFDDSHADVAQLAEATCSNRV